MELTFRYGGKTYTVKRRPEYLRQKKRGDGFTKQSAEAELTYPDGRVVTSPREVDQAIRELMGVNRDQFMQIAMIAQGDFLKLLLAPTDARIAIFRQIFKTQLFDSLHARLKAASTELYNQSGEAKNSLRQYINGILVDESDVLSLELADIRADRQPASDALPLLQKLLEGDWGK